MSYNEEIKYLRAVGQITLLLCWGNSSKAGGRIQLCIRNQVIESMVLDEYEFSQSNYRYTKGSVQGYPR